MADRPDPSDLGDGAGFVILSTGEERRPLLWECLASIQRHYPRAPVHVVTDWPVDVPFTWIKPCSGYESRRYKTQINRFSNFDVSVLLDDDTVIHKPFGRADAAVTGLGSDAIVMAPDAGFSSLGDYRDRGRGGAGVAAAKKLITADVETLPYFSSGNIIWKRSRSNEDFTTRFFWDWHQAWLAVQERDQQPLIEAQIKAAGRDQYIGRLPDSMNFVHERKAPGKSFRDMDAFVIHFWKDKLASADRYTREMGLPRAPEPMASRLFAEVLKTQHQMTFDQYRAIGSVIARFNQNSMPGANVLVFGCGVDSAFWNALNYRGRTVFVESDPLWVNRGRAAGCSVFEFQYPSQRGVWFDHFLSNDPETPTALRDLVLNTLWDVVVVDGPNGDIAGSPGREIPVMLASCCAGTVFVHDWQRPWEKAVCDQYLHRPLKVIPGTDGKGDLAVWCRPDNWVETEILGNY